MKEKLGVESTVTQKAQSMLMGLEGVTDIELDNMLFPVREHRKRVETLSQEMSKELCKIQAAWGSRLEFIQHQLATREKDLVQRSKQERKALEDEAAVVLEQVKCEEANAWNLLKCDVEKGCECLVRVMFERRAAQELQREKAEKALAAQELQREKAEGLEKDKTIKAQDEEVKSMRPWATGCKALLVAAATVVGCGAGVAGGAVLGLTLAASEGVTVGTMLATEMVTGVGASLATAKGVGLGCSSSKEGL